MAQVKPGYETVAHQEVDLQQEQPRNWHGSLLNCCGLGLGSTVLGVSTAYITHYLPCVTFGTSIRRAFGRSALRPALVVFTFMLLSWAHYATQAAFVANECVYAPPSADADGYTGVHVQQASHHQVPRHMGPGFEMHVFELDADGTVTEKQVRTPSKAMMKHTHRRCAKMFGAPLDPNRVNQSARCQRLTTAGMTLNLATITYFLMLVFYGAALRTQMRERFGIKGSRMGDFCSWFWCMQCAMCQESRTMAANNVEGGVWLGRDHQLTIVSAADMVTAPDVPVMATGVPVNKTGQDELSQAEQNCATAKL